MLETLDPRDFDEIYRLMELSFPPEERRTRAEQEALLQNPLYTVYVQKQAGEVASFAAVWQFETFAYIDHLATAPAARNGGLGARTLRQLLGAFGGQICLEVEPPETELARRRIAFYERNGFFRNDYHYLQPAITAGQRPIPLSIMTSGRSVNREEFCEIRETLYAKVYGVPQNSSLYQL